MAAADVGTGASVTFETTGFTLLATRIDWLSIDRKNHRTTHLGTAKPSTNNFGNEAFIPGDLSDPGLLVILGFFNPNTNPPLDAAPEPITVTWPRDPGAFDPVVWDVFSGFLVRLHMLASFDDLMGYVAEVKLNSPIEIVTDPISRPENEYYEGTWDWSVGGALADYYDATWDV